MCVMRVETVLTLCIFRKSLIKLTPGQDLSHCFLFVILCFYLSCGKLWIADGLWKIRFSHCAMPTKVSINNKLFT